MPYMFGDAYLSKILWDLSMANMAIHGHGNEEVEAVQFVSPIEWCCLGHGKTTGKP